jgi:uncharacterized LabA/DUF88 family protein
MEKANIYKPDNTENNMIIPGDPNGSPDDFFSDIVVFVDNPYLLRLKNYLFKEGLKYSIKNFIMVIAKKERLNVKKISLYDAPPFQSPFPTEDERRRKLKYDKVASYLKKDGIEIREGRTQRIKIGNEFIFKQKGVDMLLGIDMVNISKDFPNTKLVVLLSGDSDFVPVVEKLKKQKIRVELWTYFERKRKSPFSKSNELLRSVDNYVKIKPEDFERAKIVEHVEGLKENVKKTKQNSEELFNSLMSKAFRGELK